MIQLYSVMNFSTLTIPLIVLLGFVLPNTSAAQNGYQIEVSIDNYDADKVLLVYYYGTRQYIKDTAFVESNNRFVFQGEETLDAGVYMLVYEPNNQAVDIIITEDAQHFKVSFDTEAPIESMQFGGKSGENPAHLEYLKFLNEARAKRKDIEENTPEEEKTAAYQELNEKVVARQKAIVNKSKGTLLAALLKANIPVPMPEFTGSPQDIRVKQWLFSKEHYFDNIDLEDERLFRSPVVGNKIEYYMDKMVYNDPDSLIHEIDMILSKVEVNESVFRFVLAEHVNKYAQSKTMGHDEVYVHLVQQYYDTGKAPWVDDENLKKMSESAANTASLLIGKIAPDIKMTNEEGDIIALSDIESTYTVLYFWRYDCKACKEGTPALVDFYNQFKDKGVKIASVCLKSGSEENGCWSYINENGMSEMQNFTAGSYFAEISNAFDIKSTPLIYILDENKKIIFKRLGTDQLESAINDYMEYMKSN